MVGMSNLSSRISFSVSQHQIVAVHSLNRKEKKKKKTVFVSNNLSQGNNLQRSANFEVLHDPAHG
jgi:hypothetical protein